MKPGYIYPIKIESQFTVTANEMAQDHQLTFGARGILTYLLSLPADWSINTAHLATAYTGDRRGCGVKAIYGFLAELRTLGYVLYTRTAGAGGRWVNCYYVLPVRESRFKQLNPLWISPVGVVVKEKVPNAVKPHAVKGDALQRTHLSSSSKKKEKRNDDERPAKEKSPLRGPSSFSLGRSKTKEQKAVSRSELPENLTQVDGAVLVQLSQCPDKIPEISRRLSALKPKNLNATSNRGPFSRNRVGTIRSVIDLKVTRKVNLCRQLIKSACALSCVNDFVVCKKVWPRGF